MNLIFKTALLGMAMTSIITATGIVHKEQFIPQKFHELNDGYMSVDMQSAYEQTVVDYQNDANVTCSRIIYLSDGLKINGFMIEPTHIKPNDKLPVVIYCRGGCGNDGKINVMTMMNDMYFLAQHGYIVLASQYRGNDGSEGKDELGGSDVNDVLRLIQLVQNIPYADHNNIFMFGHSRGGTMVCMALRHHPSIRAAVIAGALTDYFAFEAKRPELIPVLSYVIPNMPQDRDNQYTKRSALYWANDINVPLLIIHGEQDIFVDVNQSKNLAHKLTTLHKPHQLILYPYSDHFLSQDRKDMHNKTLEWFGKYKSKI